MSSTTLEKYSKKINCLDLKGQHQQVKKEIFEAFEKVYEMTAFSGGPFVEEFEKAFSAYTQTKYTVGVNNGTSALHLAMLALGIGHGDEVIVPANTFIATAWGVSHAGATPVFVDCLADTWEIDPAKIESKITSKTKAVIGVHLYGMPFDIDAVKAICDKHKLFLVEDAAQAQGARYSGKPVGGFGEMACFSFYPGKNLGAWGEAGAIVTSDAALRDRVWALLQKLAADPANGIRAVWTRDDLAKGGADPRASFGIDMRNGFYSGGGHAALLSKPSGKGGHGFSPDRPELHASLVMSGPDVPKAGSLGIVRMTQIGPTIAAWFHATLSPRADRAIAWPPRSASRR